MSISRIVLSVDARRTAESLASRARDGELSHRARDLLLTAQSDPRRVAEVVLALAELAGSMLPPAHCPDDPESRAKYLRACHAAHHWGLPLSWVDEGEREYQREKKRRLRQTDQPTKGAA